MQKIWQLYGAENQNYYRLGEKFHATAYTKYIPETEMIYITSENEYNFPF